MDSSRILDIILQATDRASAVFRDVGASSQQSADEMESSSAQSSAALDGTASSAEASSAKLVDSAETVSAANQASEKVAVDSSVSIGAANDKVAGSYELVGKSAQGATIAMDGTAAASTTTAAGMDATSTAAAGTGEAMSATDTTLQSAAIGAETAESKFLGLKEVLIGTMLPLAAMFGLYIGGKDTLKDVSTNTNQYEQSEAQIVQTLKNSNDAIGLNIQQLNELADSTAKGTAITGNQNRVIEQTLLGYGAINKTTLPQSITLVDDLATRMAKGGIPSTQQLSAASKELGKSLEDPAKGMTAFTKATVTFSPSQVAAVKAMEATHGAAAAQKLEMQDLAGVVGGAASAATETFSGKIQALKNQMEPLEITIGEKVHSTLEVMGDDFVKSLPSIEAVADRVKNFLAPSIEALWNAFKNLIPQLEEVWRQYLAPLVPVVGTLLVVAFALLVNALRVVIEVITGVTKFIMSHRVALIAVSAAIATLAAMWLTVAVPAALAWAAAGVAAGIAWLVAAAPFIAIIALAAALAAAAYEVVTHWNDVKQWFDDAVKWMKQHWELIVAVVFPFMALPMLIIAKWDVVKQWFNNVKGFIMDVFKDAGKWLYNVGQEVVQGLINGVKAMANNAVNAVKGVGRDVVKGAEDILKINSPSRVFAGIGENVGLGLIQGITGTKNNAKSASADLANSTIAGASNIRMPQTNSAVSAGQAGTNGSNSGVVLNAGASLVTVNYQGKGQFTISDATDMAKMIILAMRSQGLSTSNFNNAASLR